MNDELKRRVRRGYFWLKAHLDDHDEIRFNRNLKLYEQLVDEAVKLGFTEQECIDFEHHQLTTETMTEEEMTVLFSKRGEYEQAKLN